MMVEVRVVMIIEICVMLMMMVVVSRRTRRVDDDDVRLMMMVVRIVRIVEIKDHRGASHWGAKGDASAAKRRAIEKVLCAEHIMWIRWGRTPRTSTHSSEISMAMWMRVVATAIDNDLRSKRIPLEAHATRLITDCGASVWCR